MKLIQTWGKVQRPWGWELRCDWDDQGKIINEVMNFDKEPDQKQIDLKLAEIQSRLEAVKPELPMAEMVDPEKESLKAEIVTLKAQVASLQKVVVK